MKQKIEWYREVLELEPNSRVFFPLARLEANDGQKDAAIATLRRGVQRHPDHIEARLFLIDLLFAAERHIDLWQEVDYVSSMLGGYPGFWSAWSERLSADDKMGDAGLALRFLAACLQGKSISWADVVSKGLAQILQQSTEPDIAQAITQISPPQPKVAAVANFTTRPNVDGIIADATEEGRQEPAFAAEPCLDTSDLPQNPENQNNAQNICITLTAELARTPVQDEGILLESGLPDEEENEEPFSLRTRSMADVLTEQGDYAGALAIYNELLLSSVDEAEQTELQDKIVKINTALATPPMQTQEDANEDLRSSTGKNRLLDVLESLAQRLEARS